MDPIRRISIRARGMSNAATTGRTHVSTRPYAQAKAKFSLASKGASTHVPYAHEASKLSGRLAHPGKSLSAVTDRAGNLPLPPDLAPEGSIDIS